MLCYDTFLMGKPYAVDSDEMQHNVASHHGIFVDVLILYVPVNNFSVMSGWV